MAVAVPAPQRVRRGGRLIAAGALLLAGCVLMLVAFMAALLGQGDDGDACGAGDAYAPSAAALADIPGNYLGWIRAAGREYGVDWAVIAGIYSIETNFGRLQASGVRAGENSTGAGGPGQFLAGTWAAYGVDGDRDGIRDRYNPRDAIPATANLLKAAGGQQQIERAVFAYNHASWYVADVLERAARYRGAARGAGGIPVADTAATGGGCVSGAELAVGQANARQLLENPRVTLSAAQRSDLAAGQIDARVVATIAAIAEQHSLIVTALKSDHGTYTTSGNRSNHADGRAVDIGAIDDERCTGTRTGKCGRLAVQLARVTGGMRSTELIYCFDPDGPADQRGFARADHCDHIHAGFDPGG